MAKILLLEDDLEFAKVMKIGLEDVGYSVTHCLTGRGALAKLAEEQFDVLIVDILIKTSSGLVPDGGISVITTVRTALRTMTSLGHQSRIPIIAISGSVAIADGPDLLSIAADLGANAVLRKPFSQPKLLGHITALIGDQAPTE